MYARAVIKDESAPLKKECDTGKATFKRDKRLVEAIYRLEEKMKPRVYIFIQ